MLVRNHIKFVGAGCKQSNQFRSRQPVNMTLNENDKTPLLAEEGGVRHRTHKKDDDNKEQESQKYKDWDPNLPYGGKVYLARRKKPDPLWVRVTEVTPTNS